MGTENRSGAGLGASGALSLITTVFLFQTLLENYFYKTSYLDEAIAALFFGYFLLDLLISMRIRTEDLMISCFVVLTAAAGLYANMRFGIQEYPSAILLDIISHFKFAAMYLGVCAFCRVNRVDYRSAIRLPVILAKIYIVVLFVFGVLNLFVNFGMYAEYRYGFRTYSFLPSSLAWIQKLLHLIPMRLCSQAVITRIPCLRHVLTRWVYSFHSNL